jgi:disulfide bond formation protein DsbB
MTVRTLSTKAPAYRAGALALLISLAVILAALGFEYLGGYAPCPLCLMQRYAYYAAIPLLFAALVLDAADRPTVARLIFILVGLMFLANVGLAAYHAGAEWKFWPGPDTCTAPSTSLSTSAGGLLKELERTRVARCDEAPWHFLGLSFAGWNAVFSLVLGAILLRGAATADPRVVTPRTLST